MSKRPSSAGAGAGAGEKPLGVFAAIHRKHKGQVYVTSSRVIFITVDEKQSSFDVSAITECKCSRSNAGKVQVVTANQSYVFTFTEEAVEEKRDRFRELLLPQKKGKPAPSVSGKASSRVSRPSASARSSQRVDVVRCSDAHARASILAKDANLRTLYEDLVEKDVITDEEFWRTRKHLLSSESRSFSEQSVGLSSGLLTDVRPEVGSSTVSYTLNANTISQIFAEYPPVLRAYKDNVPDKMSEDDFWTKYFRSQYFYNSTGQTSAEADDKDNIFSRYEREEDEGIEALVKQTENGSRKVSLPITRLMNLSIGERGELDSGERQQHIPGGKPVIASSKSKERLRILQKFNRHSQVVLRAGAVSSSGREMCYDRDLSESVRLPDLESQPPQTFSALRIQDPQTFFSSGVETCSVSPVVRRESTERFLGALDEIGAEEHAVDPSLHFNHAVLSSRLAALSRSNERAQTLGASGQLAIFSAGSAKDELIPAKFLGMVKERNSRIAEILRHFWSCFPVTSETQPRLQRYVDALSKQYASLQSLRKRLHSKDFSKFVPLLDPLMRCLEKAFERHQRYVKKCQSSAFAPSDTSGAPSSKRARQN